MISTPKTQARLSTCCVEAQQLLCDSPVERSRSSVPYPLTPSRNSSPATNRPYFYWPRLEASSWPPQTTQYISPTYQAPHLIPYNGFCFIFLRVSIGCAAIYFIAIILIIICRACGPGPWPGHRYTSAGHRQHWALGSITLAGRQAEGEGAKVLPSLRENKTQDTRLLRCRVPG